MASSKKPVLKKGERGPCLNCDKERVIYSRGLCPTCYTRLRREGNLPGITVSRSVRTHRLGIGRERN